MCSAWGLHHQSVLWIKIYAQSAQNCIWYVLSLFHNSNRETYDSSSDSRWPLAHRIWTPWRTYWTSSWKSTSMAQDASPRKSFSDSSAWSPRRLRRQSSTTSRTPHPEPSIEPSAFAGNFLTSLTRMGAARLISMSFWWGFGTCVPLTRSLCCGLLST